MKRACHFQVPLRRFGGHRPPEDLLLCQERVRCKGCQLSLTPDELDCIQASGWSRTLGSGSLVDEYYCWESGFQSGATRPRFPWLRGAVRSILNPGLSMYARPCRYEDLYRLLLSLGQKECPKRPLGVYQFLRASRKPVPSACVGYIPSKAGTIDIYSSLENSARCKGPVHF